MAVGSNINPNFPVPGIDQDSRGFRDNFSTIKTEIENIQSKAIHIVGGVTGYGNVIIDGGNDPIVLRTRLVGVVSNPFDYGAVGDGVTDDTQALQDAYDAIPVTGGSVIIPSGYSFMISATLIVKSKTTTFGGGKIVAAVQAAWLAGVFHCFKNSNWNASSITDSDIIFRDIELDWSTINSAGSAHLFYIRRARRVVVENCQAQRGASVTAFLGCDDTLVQGCSFKNFLNCGIDHWDGPVNARVIGNYLEANNSAQMVNFNPDPTVPPSTGYSGNGFTMTNNILIGTKVGPTPVQVEPLRANAYITGAVISNNYLQNCRLVLRGDVRSSIVANNTIVDVGGTSEAIANYVFNGGSATGLVISNNTIRNPNTTPFNLGVIRTQSNSVVIFGNMITGNTYTSTAIYRGNPALGYQAGNYAEINASQGQLQSGFRIDNGGGDPGSLGWTDASGGSVNMLCQTDNNWIFRGTGSVGNVRGYMSIYTRSDTSQLILSVPVRTQDWLDLAVSNISATGNTLTSAQSVLCNLNEVTSATAGINDAVKLVAQSGRSQTVVNSTASTINIYPHNSLSSIDGGTAGAPVSITAGKSKTFVYFSTQNYRTVAAT